MRTEKPNLTLAEMGKLWVTYMGNTMGKCIISYFRRHIEDPDIKNVLEYAWTITNNYIEEITHIFNEENFPIPVGFTEEDVNLDAPRLFKDEFYLYYLQYTAKAGVSIYSSAIGVVTREDIREFYVKCIQETVKLMTMTNEILTAKGILMNSPITPVPEEVQFVKSKSFSSGGILGKKRPPHALEVAHIFDNLNNDVTSKALIVGFLQGAQDKKVREFLERGKNINKKHIELLTNILSESDLPAPTLIDHLVTDSTTKVFSDKIMMAHKIDMFSMKIRSYGKGSSLNGRTDIGAIYARCIADVTLYIKTGAEIMIQNDWMEQPPLAPNREDLDLS